ncbi:hypothetical protein INS49_004125 [Diaporthe citri]|uniref:uncharacterized protein n=1 Tax=Diaporthe citri TaxID=83186 RepID=UPI001C7FE11A|nr:uncharacterized protein INS49_004125 [Diaporthe citri]KAG6355044.1 hypothetical protein INS49_004125 [Diaporthe citri]
MQVDFNIAKTRLVQTFTNHGNILIPEAWYSFPLYDGAAVTAFRCEVGDEKVLEGMVKPKDEARQEFNKAVKKQEAAALVEEMAPDVFQTTIGNIEPRTSVKVLITYVEELHADLSGNGIVVTIPTSLAPRYGTPPTGYATYSGVKEVGFSLVVSVASPGPTGTIICRSGHGISVEYGKLNHVPEAASFEALAELPSQADSGLNPKHATVRSANNQVAMDRDFILYIPSAYESLPMSCALLAPPSGSDLAAMMVTVRPSELFSDPQESMDEFDGEILFLADRSGSMEGLKMEQLKEGLFVFLKSIPAKCKFNLYSFGSDVSSLWPCSMQYDESTLEKALRYLSTFQADFGGTEVLKALKKAVDDRRVADVSSTQLILLTDGEIWQSEETIEFVRMKTSEAGSQLRFFSLGIGNQVSHQLIQVTKATSNNTIQYLAAKAAVRDCEYQDTPEAASPNQIRKNAKQLSQMYTISSKWTSFVAVSNLQQSAEYEDVEVSQYKAPLAELDLLARPLARPLRADGLFQLDKTSERCMAQHFCHGTRGSLRRWLARRVKEPAADDTEDNGPTWILVNTMMALAYIRSHFYELRALWVLMVQKAEGRLASLLNPGQWERPDGPAAIAASALAHAHYGRCSQGSGEGSWWMHNPGRGRCGVCNPQSEEWPSAVMHDEYEKCSVSGCDVSVGNWDEFWAHAVEQGHIYSSCEAARLRYSVDAAEAKGDIVSGDLQKAERKVIQENPEDQQVRNQSATLKRRRDVADVG